MALCTTIFVTEIARKQEEKCRAPVTRVGWWEFNVPCQHEYSYIRDDCSSSTALDFLYDVHNLIKTTDLYSRVQHTGYRQRFHATNPINLSAIWHGLTVAGFHSRMNSLQQRQRCTKLSLQVSLHYLENCQNTTCRQPNLRSNTVPSCCQLCKQTGKSN